jgi:predicted transposase/invertase (TIGR01784 family)
VEEYGMAMRAYNNVSAEEKAWAYHLSMDRAEADYWNGLELAEEKGRNKGLLEGLEDGRKQGRQEQALSAARKMLAVHLGTHEQIADITGLPLAEVEKLAAGTEPVLA